MLTIDPKNVAVQDNRGVSFYHLGNYSQDITYYDKALAIDPKNAVALTDKGNALSALGNYTLGIPLFDKALTIRIRRMFLQ